MEHDPFIGKQLGAYSIQAKIGEGGMAQVYKAYHERLHREVAIKIILPHIADQAGFRQRFEREAQLSASLEHRNIVAIYDFGDLDHLTCLVMQYVGGGTLRDLLHKNGVLSVQQATLYTIQMARALHHAHRRAIVHRDVKPQNMLISRTDPDQMLLSDFGIAKIFDSYASAETLLHTSSGNMNLLPSQTSVDQLVGTAEYMAPEQINRQPIDARTDVYALGIVFFQMLTGQLPFSSTTLPGLLYQQVYTPPKPVRAVNPHVPEVVENIILRALAKAPEQRFPSAEAMASALEATLLPATAPQIASYTTTNGQIAPDPLTNPIIHLPAPAHSSYHETQPVTGVYLANPPFAKGSAPFTSRGNSTLAPQPKARQRFQISSLFLLLVALLSIGLLANNVVLPWLCNQGLFCLGKPSTTLQNTALTSYSENFQNNNRNWSLTQKGLTALPSNGQYLLGVSDASTYFPHPDPMGTTAGPLPQNFVVSVNITETQGLPTTLYGLVFRLQGSDNSVNSYAFVVDGQGNYYLEKYTANKLSNVFEGQSSNIHTLNQANTLQVTVRGNSFTFSINSQVLTIPGSATTTYTDSDHPWTGGQIGILVSGSNTKFVVHSVVLETH